MPHPATNPSNSVFIPAGLSIALHTLAADIVASQPVADRLDGLAVACGGAAAAIGWFTGRRWLGITFGVLTLMRALLGPNDVRPRGGWLFVFDLCLVGLILTAILFQTTLLLRHRRTQPS